MDIKTADITQLKALAFDLILQKEQVQANLNLVTQEIVERSKQVKEEPVFKNNLEDRV